MLSNSSRPVAPVAVLDLPCCGLNLAHGPQFDFGQDRRETNRQSHCTDLQHCVGMTIEVDGTAGDVELSSRTKAGLGQRKIHLAGSSYRFAEKSLQYSRNISSSDTFKIKCLSGCSPASRSSSGIVLTMTELQQQTDWENKSHLECFHLPSGVQRAFTALGGRLWLRRWFTSCSILVWSLDCSQCDTTILSPEI